MAISINSLMADSERAAAGMLSYKVSAALGTAGETPEQAANIEQLALAAGLKKTTELIGGLTGRVDELRALGIEPAKAGGKNSIGAKK